MWGIFHEVLLPLIGIARATEQIVEFWRSFNLEEFNSGLIPI